MAYLVKCPGNSEAFKVSGGSAAGDAGGVGGNPGNSGNSGGNISRENNPGKFKKPVTGIKPRVLSFQDINDKAISQISSLLKTWLSDGNLKGREWVAKNPTRNDKRAGSFCINVDTGKWGDFATGDRGGDVISLYAYLNGLSQIKAAQGLSSLLGGRYV